VFHIQYRSALFVSGVRDTRDPPPGIGLDLFYF
jgi:hypothetical protein